MANCLHGCVDERLRKIVEEKKVLEKEVCVLTESTVSSSSSIVLFKRFVLISIYRGDCNVRNGTFLFDVSLMISLVTTFVIPALNSTLKILRTRMTQKEGVHNWLLKNVVT